MTRVLFHRFGLVVLHSSGPGGGLLLINLWRVIIFVCAAQGWFKVLFNTTLRGPQP